MTKNENYFEKTLGEACGRIPDFLVVKIECKFYKSEDSFVPMIEHESLTRLYARNLS